MRLFVAFPMKKYKLTIIYDKEGEDVQSIKQEIVDMKPKENRDKVEIQFNRKFVKNLPHLDQKVINMIFDTATTAGALMGDA